MQIRIIIVFAIIAMIGMPVFAQYAPVYDADAMMEQSLEDGSADQSRYLPPPPPPEQDVSDGYVRHGTPVGPVASSMSMGQRMRRIEQQIVNIQHSDDARRMEVLQEEVQSLRGQIEVLVKQLEQLKNQQKGLYEDIEKRLVHSASGNSEEKPSSTKAVSTTVDKPASISGPKPANAKKAGKKTDSEKSVKLAAKPVKPKVKQQPDVVEEQKAYQTAYNLIKARKYDEAVKTLKSMLKKYPSGQFASNAHYWLGELYGLMDKHKEALAEFGEVVKSYPDSPRVSDAQLKVGLILASQLEWSDAKKALKKVVDRYPGTASARLASEQLKEIKQAGH